MLVTRYRFFAPLGLWPRGYPEQQHFFQAPDMIGESRCHCRRTRPPELGRTRALGGYWLHQYLSQAGVREHEIVIHLEQDQLLAQAGRAFARGRAPASNRCHPLTQAEIDPLNKGGIDLPPADC